MAKKQSKIKKTLNWLKPTSPVRGMLLFAIVFAVIGGGVMAYRSFAATSYTQVKKAGNIYLANGSGTKQTDSHGGLPNTTIWRLEKGAKVYTEYKINAQTSHAIYAKFCVRIRFAVKGDPTVVGASGAYLSNKYLKNADGSTGLEFVLIGDLTYDTYCSSAVRVGLNTGNNTIRTTVLNDTRSPSDLYIQNMSMRWN